MSAPPAPVRGRKQFAELARSPRRVRSGLVTVHFVPAQVGDEVLVSYSIGRKVGGAVVRNRLRRRLRALTGDLAHELEPGAYLIRVGPAVQAPSFAELREQVANAMRKVNRIAPREELPRARAPHI